MVKIRLLRTGAKNNPHYRIVASDSRSKRDGKVIEILGWYNPSSKRAKIKIDSDRFHKWLSYGAQPTQAVLKLTNK